MRTKLFLLEIADRIDTVAKLHRLIAHPDSDAIELHIYLQEICQRLGNALATTAAPSFSVSCPLNQTVPFSVAMPLGLITAELFSNSLNTRTQPACQLRFPSLARLSLSMD